MSKLDDKLVELSKGDTTFFITAEYLLELASKARTLFESSQPAKKNKILKILLAIGCLQHQKIKLGSGYRTRSRRFRLHDLRYWHYHDISGCLGA